VVIEKYAATLKQRVVSVESCVEEAEQKYHRV
jgi:hypothetical protein